MHAQSARLFLYSSLAIVALTLVWGLRAVPKQSELAERTLRASLEQELIVLTAAVRSANEALKYKLLDVLKSENPDRPSQVFKDSPFASATLIEWAESQWKVSRHHTKFSEELSMNQIKTWLKEWPLATIHPDESSFFKVIDVQGTPHFAVLIPMRKSARDTMMGIGVFPAAQYGLAFSADRSREVRVFTADGYALALTHPAYLGASVRREPLVNEILANEEVSLRHEWRNSRGMDLIGAAIRLPSSNLYAAIESRHPLTAAAALQFWIYLALCAAGALLINWFLFHGFTQPLLKHLTQAEELIEQLKRQLLDRPRSSEAPVGALVTSEISHLDFVEKELIAPPASASAPVSAVEAHEPPRVPLSKVVSAALRSLDGRIKEQRIQVSQSGMEGIDVGADVLQLQTALEEVIKNAIEAMQNSSQRILSLSACLRGTYVHLAIADTGIGIPQEDLIKVFDPFFSTKDSEGVARGLGLNVVRRVMEEMEGNVSVHGRLGSSLRGTVVEMEWPALEKPEAKRNAGLETPASVFAPELESASWIETPAAAAHPPPLASNSRVRLQPGAGMPIRRPKVRALD